ncbi:C39 family peptidase [Pullulanibacillus pueri]|nr:C39 family peptidase [Pullulanibacillus pueri]
MGNQRAKKVVPIDAPLIQQLPELPRGCEVTSLAMLLQSAGIKVNKLQLAKEIKKDPTPYQGKDGHIFFGNPNTGFVGSMDDKAKAGFGVYHGPIFQLAKHYLPQAVDLTGSSFARVEEQLTKGRAVWVITSINFEKVPENLWVTWRTPIGKIRVTKKEHSVLLTGYDSRYVYINDPLSPVKNKKVLKKDFIAAWQQFGSQAVSYR